MWTYASLDCKYRKRHAQMFSHMVWEGSNAGTMVLFHLYLLVVSPKPGTRARRQKKYEVDFDVVWRWAGECVVVLRFSKVFRSTFVSDQNSKMYSIIIARKHHALCTPLRAHCWDVLRTLHRRKNHTLSNFYCMTLRLNFLPDKPVESNFVDAFHLIPSLFPWMLGYL